jgi:hypothetical protein
MPENTPNKKLIDALQECREVLTQEVNDLKPDRDKNTTRINTLTDNLVIVNKLIAKIGTNEFQKILVSAKANQTALTEGIVKLKEQVTAKSKKPVSFKPILDEVKKIENLLKK